MVTKDSKIRRKVLQFKEDCFEVELGGNKLERSTKWSLVFFFGWLLSFPLQGPVLYSLATAWNVDGNRLGLVFIFFHALGLVAAGLFLSRRIHHPIFLPGLSLVCLFVSLAFLFAEPQLYPVLLAILGVVSGLYVISWALPYTVYAGTHRIRFMAEVIIGANIIYYLTNLLSSFAVIGGKPLLMTLTMTLLVVAWFSRTLYPIDRIKIPQVKSFPLDLVALLSFLVLGVYINGGLMYSIIFPSFVSFASISRVYRILPYMAVLVVALFLRRRWSKVDLFYLGVAFLGLGFVSYIAFQASLLGYFLTETFILAGLALLDLGLWTLSADIAEVYGYIAGVFGTTLAANVMALHIGGLLGAKLVTTGDPYLKTGLSAFFIIFLIMALIPGLGRQINRRLVKRKEELLAAKKSSHTVLEELNRITVDSLTPREREVISLILRGCGNLEIASTLGISDNTVKVHVKNVNKKVGVANKNELLSLAIRIFMGQEKSNK